MFAVCVVAYLTQATSVWYEVCSTKALIQPLHKKVGTEASFHIIDAVHCLNYTEESYIGRVLLIC